MTGTAEYELRGWHPRAMCPTHGAMEAITAVVDTSIEARPPEPGYYTFRVACGATRGGWLMQLHVEHLAAKAQR